MTAELMSARDRLLVTAERLIAEQGIAVSLREVSTAAGQRNNSAVHYHFGNRDALIEAIVDLRQEPLERRRLELLAEQEAADLTTLVEILVSPMFDVPYADGSTHYARFLEKVRDHPAIVDRPLTSTHWPATGAIIARLDRHLDGVAREMRAFRLHSLMTAMFALLADLERSGETRPARRRQLEQGVLDLLVGMLSAPDRT